MPQQPNLTRARLTEIWLDKEGAEIAKPTTGQPMDFEVQFNPQTLRISHSTQRAGGDQPRGSPQQFVGRAASRLTLELWFDITRTSNPTGDVRALTGNVSYFLEPKKIPNREPAPCSVRFQWGSFLFRGNMDSVDETVELFSEDGRGLRASVSISLTGTKAFEESGAESAAGTAAGAGVGLPGTTPLVSAQAGLSLPQMSASMGVSADWKAVASANGIENPRRLEAGVQIDFSARAG